VLATMGNLQRDGYQELEGQMLMTEPSIGGILGRGS
jgi:hypothetical protein